MRLRTLPGERWRFGGAVVLGLAFLVLGVALVGYPDYLEGRRGEVRTLAERLHSWAESGATQPPGDLPGTATFRVLDGRTYRLHEETARVTTRLQRDDLEDKALFDIMRELKGVEATPRVLYGTEDGRIWYARALEGDDGRVTGVAYGALPLLSLAEFFWNLFPIGWLVLMAPLAVIGMPPQPALYLSSWGACSSMEPLWVFSPKEWGGSALAKG